MDKPTIVMLSVFFVIALIAAILNQRGLNRKATAYRDKRLLKRAAGEDTPHRFFIEREERTILLHFGEGLPVLIISKTDLYDWLDKEDRLSYTSDWYDASQSDGHGQRWGVLTFHDYYDTVDDAEFRRDIEAYVRAFIQEFNKHV